MCGICGIITHNPSHYHKRQIREMLAAIRHRGPDEQRIYTKDLCFLAHARLSIIDVESSKQPMTDSTGRFTLVFNGEIYNYIELRDELRSKGIEFSTTGDTEVLLHALITWGKDCLSKLNGMFAFALWDSHRKKLLIARDRLGQKPLFYTLIGNTLYFASEFCAFKVLNMNLTLNEGAIHEYLEYGFIRSPQTIFKEIKELRPATFLEYNSGQISTNNFWSIPLEPHSFKKEDTLKKELLEILYDSVRIRLRSDVPLGAFLSGGLDSSIIVSLMKEIIPHGELHTFCIGFDQDSFDETDFAREVAGYFSTSHHEKRISLDIKRLENLLPQLIRHYGQPFGDSSAIPTWFLCSHTASRVKVALSGDGGDELFGGYQRYLAQKILLWYRKIPRPIREKVLNKTIKILPDSTSYYQKSFIKKLKLFARMDQKTTQNLTNYYSACFHKDEIAQITNINPQQNNISDKIYDPGSQPDPITFMMFNDLTSYLPDDILTKVDRASMAQGLEVRSPFMDYRVVEFACQLPVKYKINGLTTKYLLRKSFSSCLPNNPVKRAKHGFCVPISDWFKGGLIELAREVLIKSPPDFINAREIEKLLQIHTSGKEDMGHRLWLLLSLGLWYRWWFKE